MRTTLAGFFAFSLCLHGCGGDASGPGDGGVHGEGMCSVSGCGGDIEGTWAVTSVCAHLPGAVMTGLPACDTVGKDAVNSAKFAPMGLELAFTGMTYTQTGSVKATFTYAYTNACLTAQSGLTASVDTCAEVQMNLNNAGQAGTCRFSADTCVCDMDEVFPASDSGAYSVEGTALVMGSDKTPFCVHGDTAELATSNSSFSGSMSLERR
jgi:hypothetical protein